MDRLAPASHGPIYVVSGVWLIVHSHSFERVTGPKADRWLVKTVGGLLPRSRESGGCDVTVTCLAP